MKKLVILIAMVIVSVLITGYSVVGQQKSGAQKSGNSVNTSKQTMALPEEYVDTHPEQYDIVTFIRYEKMLISPITYFHDVYGRMPSTLNEFFDSDFCLVRAKEKETGLLFQEAEALDVNHPEYLVYKYIDDDTAKLSFLLKTPQGEPYIHTYQWNKERFWAFFPRDAEGRDAKEWEQRVKTKPPTTTKKAKVMIEQLGSLFGAAVVDYFDDHNGFPESMDTLFSEKWGEFRQEPWRNFQYDDPAKKLPTKIFGFDKNQNYYYCHTFWEDGAKDEYALKLPANLIERSDHPLNMHTMAKVIINDKLSYSEGDIDTLNIEFFADVESLRNL